MCRHTFDIIRHPQNTTVWYYDIFYRLFVRHLGFESRNHLEVVFNSKIISQNLKNLTHWPTLGSTIWTYEPMSGFYQLHGKEGKNCLQKLEINFGPMRSGCIMQFCRKRFIADHCIQFVSQCWVRPMTNITSTSVTSRFPSFVGLETSEKRSGESLREPQWSERRERQEQVSGHSNIMMSIA